MHIMTERGWRPLSTPITNKLSVEPPIYRGSLPSLAALAFIASMESEHQQWLERRKALLAEAA
jgi:hypothetical protein